MIVLDANLLLYAYDVSSPQNARARAWLEKVLSSSDLVGLPWQAIHGFLRIATNTNLPGDRYSMQEAIAIVESWLDQPNVRVLAPGASHWFHLKDLLISGQIKGRSVTDAVFAALSVEHGGIFQSTDRGFARFPDLRWTNPIA